MSILGFNPRLHYKGRSIIEARSLEIPVLPDEVVFRLNLVSVFDGRMESYCAGHISTSEARPLILDLDRELGNEKIKLFTGVGYRHICKIKGHKETLLASCTPPHNIRGKPIAPFLPHGEGSDLLRDLMFSSQEILRGHPINQKRIQKGNLPASMIWLFWGSEGPFSLPSFSEVYGREGALTSGVDLLCGLAKALGMAVLSIPHVTDGLDNDYAAQAEGALRALDCHDLVVIHVEAPDEAAHSGEAKAKIEAIEKIDDEIVRRLVTWDKHHLQMLILPDHPTPVLAQTHVREAVPFLIQGPNIVPSGVKRFTEEEARKSGIVVEGYAIMRRFLT
jgi:2,3-bisphosphoglycerate-independent phosphoglycerate mutase